MQLGLDGRPVPRWLADPMRSLDVLWRRGVEPLRTRSERLQGGMAVRLNVGELVDQVSRTGDRAADAFALVGQVVTRCGLQGHVRCVAPHRRTRGGTPDQVLVFHDRDDAADARRALLEMGLVDARLGDLQVRVSVQSCLPHLDPETTVVTVYRLGFDFAREGAVEAILAAAGYGPESVSVQAAFIGDLPAACLPWAGGPCPIGRADVIVAYVRAPPGDELLQRMPRSFEQGWDDPTVDVRVRTRYCRQDPLAPEGQQHEGPGGRLQERGGPAVGSQHWVVTQPPHPPPPPPPQPHLPPPPPQPRYDPLGLGGGSSARGGATAASRVPHRSGDRPSAAPVQVRPHGDGPGRESLPGTDACRGGRGPAPMEVASVVPEGALAEACFAMLEDYCEGLQHSDCCAIVAAVAQQHGSAWEACAHGRGVPGWCADALLAIAHARCPDAVVMRPARLERAGAAPQDGHAVEGGDGMGPTRQPPHSPAVDGDASQGGGAPRAAKGAARVASHRRNPTRRARGRQVSYGPQGSARSLPPSQGGAGR